MRQVVGIESEKGLRQPLHFPDVEKGPERSKDLAKVTGPSVEEKELPCKSLTPDTSLAPHTLNFRGDGRR